MNARIYRKFQANTEQDRKGKNRKRQVTSSCFICH
nr:MAG TPA: hypothetical protein [Caudoviricetes sp.]